MREKFVYDAEIGDNTKFVYAPKMEQKAKFVYKELYAMPKIITEVIVI